MLVKQKSLLFLTCVLVMVSVVAGQDSQNETDSQRDNNCSCGYTEECASTQVCIQQNISDNCSCVGCGEVFIYCDQCTQSMCIECQPPYILSQTNMSCVPELPHCQQYGQEGQCLHCQLGWGLGDQGECQQCEQGLGDGQCGQGDDGFCGGWCAGCGGNWSLCSVCGEGGVDQMGDCVQCQQDQCANCSKNYTECLQCKDGYVLLPNQTCVACPENCLSCQLFDEVHFNCTQCNSSFGFNLSDHLANSFLGCRRCLNNNCVQCFENYKICTNCRWNFGVNKSYIASSDPQKNQCIKCEVQNCISCGSNSLSCFECTNRTGVNETNQCQSCVQQCQSCGRNFQNCTKCSPPFGLRHNSQTEVDCANCTIEQCLNCSNNYLLCQQCDEGYGVDEKSQCTECNNKCLNCSGKDYNHCTACANNLYLAQGQCLPCSDMCIHCEKANVCLQCYETHYTKQWNSSSDDIWCVPCDYPCARCESLENNTGVMNCKECQNGFFLNHSTTPHFCQQVCGDFFLMSQQLECDNDINIQFDGCDASCETENDFECKSQTVQENEDNRTYDIRRSICSYTKEVEFTVRRMNTIEKTNKFWIEAKVNPPLHVFSTTELSPHFTSADESETVISVSFDQSTGFFAFELHFSEDIFAGSIQVQFVPNTTEEERFFKTPNSSLNLDIRTLLYQPEFGFSLMAAVTVLSYAIVASTWVSVILGLLAKNLASVELMMAVQILWTSLLWTNFTLFELFEAAFPLKYGCSYNVGTLLQSANQNRLLENANKWTNEIGNADSHRLLSDSSATVSFDSKNSLSFFPPHFAPLQMDPSNLLNNLNVSLILQIVPLCTYAICTLVNFHLRRKSKNDIFVKHSVFDKNKVEMGNNKQNKSKMQKVDWLTGVFAQMSLTMFFMNLTNFVNSLILFFRFSSIELNISNIAVLCVGTLTFGGTLLALWLDPDSFDYFRYSFKRNELALSHCYLYIVMMVSASVLKAMLPSLFYVPIIPPTVLMLLTLITRPYRHLQENVRAVVCLIIICGVSAIDLVLTLCSRSFAFVYFFALFVILTLYSVGTICYLVYISYRVQLNIIDFDRKMEISIMEEIDYDAIREKIKKSAHNPIFQKVVNKMSLLDFSNRISAMALDNDFEFQECSPSKEREDIKLEIKHFRINHEEELDTGKRLRKFMTDSKNQSSKQPEAIQIFLNQLCQENKSSQKRNQIDENINNNLDLYLKMKDDKSRRKFFSELSKAEQQEMLEKKYALKIAIEENSFLKVKDSEQTINSLMQEKDANCLSYIQAYEKI